MTVSQWLVAHPFVAGVLTMFAPAVLGAIVNWFTWKGTPEEWAAYRAAHPRMATAILLVRMLLPHLRQIPKIAAYLPPASVKPPNPYEGMTDAQILEKTGIEFPGSSTSVTQTIKTPVSPVPDTTSPAAAVDPAPSEPKPTEPESPEAKAKDPS